MSDGSEPRERYRLLGVVPREIEQREEQEPDDTVFTWPHFLIRHVVVAAVTIAIVFAIAIAFDAPLKDIGTRASRLRRPRPPGTSPACRSCSRTCSRWSGDPRPRRRPPVPDRPPVPRSQRGWRITEDGRDRAHRARADGVGAHGRRRFFRGPGWSWVWPGTTSTWSCSDGRRRNTCRDTPVPAHSPRDFLDTTWKVLGVALIVEAGWTSYDILNPNPAAGFGGIVDAGHVEDYLTEGTVKYFLDGRFYVTQFRVACAPCIRSARTSAARSAIARRRAPPRASGVPVTGACTT